MTEWARAYETAVSRVELRTPDGLSGSTLERLVLEDGRVVIVKRGDEHGLLRLWEAGVLSRLPRGVAHPIVAVERFRGGVLVVMRDVGPSFQSDEPLSVEVARRVGGAVKRIHRAFEGEDLGELGLATTRAYMARFAPRAVASGHPLRDAIRRGWSHFHGLAPRGVSGDVEKVHVHAHEVAAAFEELPRTLVHGDVRPANVAADGSAIVLLDWGAQTAFVPGVLEWCDFLALYSHRVPGTLDALDDGGWAELEQLRRGALVVALARYGWAKALVAVEAPDERTRTRQHDDLAAWFAHVQRA